MKRSDFASPAGAQRGAATLIVVMVLFFIVTLVAAYTNRNLIFEQRTSTNQYRSTQALEAAEAGVEWALAMLNHQRITAACTNSSVTTDGSYRQRYIETDWDTGNLTPKLKPDGKPRSQACVFDGAGGWSCSCPDDTEPALVAPGGNDIRPAFRVRLEQIGPVPVAGPPSRPGVIRVHAVGCTRLDNACLDFDSQGVSQEGRAEVKVLVALTGNAASPPSAAVLARGNIDLLNATVVNSEPSGSGITLHAGGVTAHAAFVYSTPGTPSDQSIVHGDPALQMLLNPAGAFEADDRMFSAVFNMPPDSFRQQPAAWELDCGGGGGTCSAAAVRSAIQTHPGRPLWVPGNLVIDTAGDIGSIDPATGGPVLLIVNGNLTFTTDAAIFGLVYVRNADWVTSGPGRIHGAAVAQGSISGGGNLTFVRDSEVLQRLRHGIGSFVRVPGSWVDFK